MEDRASSVKRIEPRDVGWVEPKAKPIAGVTRKGWVRCAPPLSARLDGFRYRSTHPTSHKPACYCAPSIQLDRHPAQRRIEQRGARQRHRVRLAVKP